MRKHLRISVELWHLILILAVVFGYIWYKNKSMELKYNKIFEQMETDYGKKLEKEGYAKINRKIVGNKELHPAVKSETELKFPTPVSKVHIVEEKNKEVKIKGETSEGKIVAPTQAIKKERAEKGEKWLENYWRISVGGIYPKSEVGLSMELQSLHLFHTNFGLLGGLGLNSKKFFGGMVATRNINEFVDFGGAYIFGGKGLVRVGIRWK